MTLFPVFSNTEIKISSVAVWCCVVQCGAVWCSVVQCGAVWCSVVQCGAVWCSVVQRRLKSDYIQTANNLYLARGQFARIQLQDSMCVTCMYTYIYKHIYICKSVYMYTYIYIHICVYIYI